MPLYSYTAKNTKGETESGTMQAADKVGVARALRRKGFVPLAIEIQKGGKTSAKGGNFLQAILKFDVGRVFDSIRGVPLADRMMFSRHLAVMLSAGVPIIRALTVLAKQTKNTRFKGAILKVADDIRGGKRIADSLARHPGIFTNLYVSMVRSGDAAGNLTEVLELLADHLKKEHDLRSRIKGALMYPAVIVTAMGGIGALMMVMVVPKIAKIFEDLGTELPLSTRVVIGTSDFIADFWIFILVSLPFFLYGVKKVSATKRGRRLLSWLFLRMPIVKGLTRKINSARFARTLSSLIEGGVPILEAVDIVKDTLSNVYYKESLEEIGKEVKRGTSLHEAVARFENIYPGLIVQMVEVGEETGALGDVLRRIAEFYEEEVDNATKNLSTVIEPILMLVIGLVVGIFAVSMIQPMYSLMGNV